MKLHKILESEDTELEEGWKETLTGLAAAGLISGMPMAQAEPVSDKQEPTTTQVDNSTLQDPFKPPSGYGSAKSTVTGNTNELILRKAAGAAGIEGVELAAFLSQCAHESLGFSRLEERGEKQVARYESGRLAKVLGNTEKGDGKKYKGRGFIHLTGRWNYTKAAKQTGIDLVNQPELASEPDTAAILAVWYWKFRVQPRVQDYDDVRAVTKPINSGLSGLADRTEKYKIFKKALA